MSGLLWELWVGHYEAARAQFAAFIDATAEEAAIIPYASAGINSLAIRSASRIATTWSWREFEFPTTLSRSLSEDCIMARRQDY
jgi:hypothetical protein